MAALAVEFLGREHVSIGDPGAVDRGRDAELGIADKGLLVHMRAIAEAIAIEENVARHGAALDPAEHIPAEVPARQEIVGADEAGPDARWPEIRRQIEADADHAAEGGLGR